MSRPTSMRGGFAVGKPTRIVASLIIANVVLWVVQVILLRSPASAVVEMLYLSPRDVYGKGYIWQMATYGFFHDWTGPGHLLWNMVALWLFGTHMERWWGSRRFMTGYGIFVLAGGLLTVLVGAFAEIPGVDGVMPRFPTSLHLGASGGVIGVEVAWGLTHAKRRLSFFGVFEMTGMTFVLLIVGVQVLTALSLGSGVSVTAHFGGIIAAVVLNKGLWKPSNWSTLLRRSRLKRSKVAIERELRKLEKTGATSKGWRVIDGGESKDDPKKWN